jgi:endonuclease YncB( thermonuclease family)
VSRNWRRQNQVDRWPLRKLGFWAVFILICGLWQVWKRTGTLARPPRARVITEASEPAATAQRRSWEKWEQCRMLPHRNNDGDSFLVVSQGREQMVRLYFVDCPEKEVRRDNQKRLAEQSGYFGGHHSPAQMAAWGSEAKSRVQALFTGAEFTLWTKREQVYDSDRIYAHVHLPDGTALAEFLVVHGLARIHTKAESIPNLGSAQQYKRQLQQLEVKAVEESRGAWMR